MSSRIQEIEHDRARARARIVPWQKSHNGQSMATTTQNKSSIQGLKGSHLYILHGLQFTAQRIQKLRGLRTQKKTPQTVHARTTRCCSSPSMPSAAPHPVSSQTMEPELDACSKRTSRIQEGNPSKTKIKPSKSKK